jgi:putative toxin-antitoxin system antitoxin component (TIGR02293 family)
MSYIWVTNVRHMKKKERNIPYKAAGLVSKVQEPSPVYRSVKALPQVKDFTYSEFKKIADKAPLTQAEWAAILHISERTLQRYAKNNGVFAAINAERALQIAHVVAEGKRTFGKTEMFYQWIKSNPFMLEGSLSFESLTTAHGIQMILTQLARIQHGILA